MVGKALIKTLSKDDKYEVISTSRKKLDQTNQKITDNWIKKISQILSYYICFSRWNSIKFKNTSNISIWKFID